MRLRANENPKKLATETNQIICMEGKHFVEWKNNFVVSLKTTMLNSRSSQSWGQDPNWSHTHELGMGMHLNIINMGEDKTIKTEIEKTTYIRQHLACLCWLYCYCNTF